MTGVLLNLADLLAAGSVSVSNEKQIKPNQALTTANATAASTFAANTTYKSGSNLDRVDVIENNVLKETSRTLDEKFHLFSGQTISGVFADWLASPIDLQGLDVPINGTNKTLSNAKYEGHIIALKGVTVNTTSTFAAGGGATGVAATNLTILLSNSVTSGGNTYQILALSGTTAFADLDNVTVTHTGGSTTTLDLSSTNAAGHVFYTGFIHEITGSVSKQQTGGYNAVPATTTSSSFNGASSSGKSYLYFVPADVADVRVGDRVISGLASGYRVEDKLTMSSGQVRMTFKNDAGTWFWKNAVDSTVENKNMVFQTGFNLGKANIQMTAGVSGVTTGTEITGEGLTNTVSAVSGQTVTLTHALQADSGVGNYVFDGGSGVKLLAGLSGSTSLRLQPSNQRCYNGGQRSDRHHLGFDNSLTVTAYDSTTKTITLDKDLSQNASGTYAIGGNTYTAHAGVSGQNKLHVKDASGINRGRLIGTSTVSTLDYRDALGDCQHGTSKTCE